MTMPTLDTPTLIALLVLAGACVYAFLPNLFTRKPAPTPSPTPAPVAVPVPAAPPIVFQDTTATPLTPSPTPGDPVLTALTLVAQINAQAEFEAARRYVDEATAGVAATKYQTMPTRRAATRKAQAATPKAATGAKKAK